MRVRASSTIWTLSGLDIGLAEPSRGVLYWSGGIACCTQVHLSEFGHLGHVGVVCPLGHTGSGLRPCLLNAAHGGVAPKLERLPPNDSLLVGHGLKAPIGFVE
jgi:hypothetical protein